MHASGEYSSKCPWPRHWLYDGWPLMLGGGLKAEKTFGIFLFSFKLNIFGVIGDFRTSIYPVHTIVITLLYHQRQMYFPLWCDEVLFLKLLPKELVTVKSTDTSSPSLASFLVVISYLKPLWVISQTFLRPEKRGTTRQQVHDYVEIAPLGESRSPLLLSSICKRPPSQEAFDKQPIFRPLWVERGVWRGGDVY